ncbi:unnamed protein product [Durusdinium trenchii]|uniref:Mycocerosic acid synthase n=2 Tax=Durusdinium trenchii TaxID=1381693 RepID=A0ABP0JPQ6_9DINO
MREAIKSMQEERAATGAAALRLTFRTHYRNKFTKFQRDLDAVMKAWREMMDERDKTQEGRARDLAAKAAAEEQRRAQRAERQRRRFEAREAQRRLRQESGAKRREELRARRRRAVLARLARLKSLVSKLMNHYEKSRRRRLLSTWGVPELPEGLQLSSFQSPDDTLCALLRLSDGSVRPGPYRTSLAAAKKDLAELRLCQARRGDQAMCQELERRDVDAMSAFFAQSLRGLQ